MSARGPRDNWGRYIGSRRQLTDARIITTDARKRRDALDPCWTVVTYANGQVSGTSINVVPTTFNSNKNERHMQLYSSIFCYIHRWYNNGIQILLILNIVHSFAY